MKKAICLLQICLMVWMPYAASADTFDDFASEGQAEGRLMIPLPGDLIHMDELSGDLVFNPGSSGEVSIAADQVFSGQTGFDPQSLIDEGVSEAGIVNLTDQQATNLSTEVSSTGQAWRTVIDSQHNSHPDLRNDPVWGATDAILAETFSGMFQSCEKTQNVISAARTDHIPDYKTCERITNPTGACTIEHNYSASWGLETGVEDDYCTPGVRSGSYNIGKISGSAHPELSLNVDCPEVASSVIPVNFYFNRWCNWNYVGQWFSADLEVSNDGVIEIARKGTIDIWSRADHTIKDDPNLIGADYYRRGCYLTFEGGDCMGTRCDLDFRFVSDYNWDDSYYNTIDRLFTVSIKRPGTYVKEVVDEWYPDSCIEKAQTILDEGFCDVAVECVDAPAGNCTTPDGSIEVCTGDLAPAPVPGLSNLCREATVGVTGCDWNVGPMDCYVDANGQMQCPVNDGSNTDGCAELENNPGCGFIRSTCIDGLLGASGFCYGWEDLYDCGVDVVSNTALIEEFYECDGDTRCIENGGSGDEGATQQDMSNTLSDIERCVQGYLPPGESATAYHHYDAELIRLVGGEGGISTCGPNCLNIWVGRVGDNYWRGSCAIYEQETNLEITNDEAFTSVTIDRAIWDDYMQIWMGEDKLVSLPNSNFPPETAGRCELSTSWNRALDVDVTDYFQNKGPLDFLTRVSVTGGGEGYSRMRAYYDRQKLITNEYWEMSNKIRTALENKESSGCDFSFRCLEDPIPAGSDCGYYNGFQVCKDMFEPLPEGIEGVSPSCRQVEISYNCETENTSGLTTCNELEDAGCSFLSGDCIPEFDDEESGICWLEERSYDCSEMLEPTSSAAALVCGVRCMGTECVSHDPMISTDFARAAGLMQAAQFIGQDTNCGTEETGGACKVFNGEAYKCKKALGGWVDCCESPGGISLKDYIDLLQAGNKVLSAKKWLGTINNPVAGGWNGAKDIAVKGLDKISGTVNSAYTSMTQSFTAAWEGIAGKATAAATEVAGTTVTTGAGTAGGAAGTSVVGEGVFSAVGTMVNTLTEQTARWVMNTFGEAAVNAIFSSTTTTVAASGAVSTTTGSASSALTASSGTTGAVGTTGTAAGGTSTTTIGLGGTILGPIMMAYMIYAVLNILVNIIWECEEREFEYGAKRQLKSCHYVGTYCSDDSFFGCVEVKRAGCCFTSPMSRILQEQIRPQLGMSWGTARNPNCDGIPIEALERVDWNQVDLSEWIGILTVTDNNPEIDASLLEMDTLTGSGNAMNDAVEEFEREDVLERTKARLDGYNPQDVNEEMSQGLYGY